VHQAHWVSHGLGVLHYFICFFVPCYIYRIRDGIGFIPLSKNPYLVLVARRGEFNPHGLSAFLAQAGQGVSYANRVWHHTLVALCEVSEFIVIDRGKAGSNCEELRLGEPVIISEKDLYAVRVCSPPGTRIS
jgi:hypothetical protein